MYEGAAKQKPEAWPNAPDPGTKAGRNVSSVFGPPQIVTPPQQPPKPVPTIATSTVAQQRSSVFGSPRYPSPRPVQPEYASSLHMDAPRAASPIRPRHKPKDPVLLGANGKPRAPNSNAEMQVSSVLGGSLGADTQALMHDQHRVSKSLLRVEFMGLPPDCNTSRLHTSLSALPFDKGVTCDVNKVRVPYDAINGRGVGKLLSPSDGRSPSIDRLIGIACLEADLAEPGNRVEVALPDGRLVPAYTDTFPIYDPEKKRPRS